MKSWVVLLVILTFLLGACSAMAGGAAHWPASLPAVAAIVGLKLANDRLKILAWPMEFLLASAIVLILFNLARLYFLPLPY